MSTGEGDGSGSAGREGNEGRSSWVNTGGNMEDSMESRVSNKGEHSMAMGVQVDGEDTLSNEDTPSNNVGMPVQVKSVLSVDAKSQTALSMKLSV
ncbi:uncharacterized protein LOC144617720 isoform X2 [Crassostrea virginica]